MNVRLLFVAPCLLIGPLLGTAAAQGSHYATGGFQSAVAAGSASGWYAGVEATFLTPHNLGTGPMTFAKTTAGGTAQVGLTNLTEFKDLEGAPRVWLGYKGDVWGLRGRYWILDADVTSTQLGVGDSQFVSLFGTQLLSAKTGDLEVTRCFGLGQWGGDLFFGARWAEFDRSDSMQVDLVEVAAGDPFPTIVDRDSARFGSRTIASGVGLTFGWEGRRPVGDWGLALVCNARGSTLWGNAGSRGYQSYLGQNVLALQTAEVDEIGSLWIGELQAGLEWSGALRRFNAEVFTHVVFEYQFWRAANQTPFLMDQSITTPSGTVQMQTGSLGSDADLLGVAWAVGFRR